MMSTHVPSYEELQVELAAAESLIESLRDGQNALEERLRVSEELHRLVLTNLSGAVLMTDDAGEFTYVCPNVHEIFGHSEHEVRAIGQIRKLFGVDPIDLVALHHHGEVRNVRHTITDKWGQSRHLLVNAKRIDGQGGTILYACRDFTQELQEQTRAAECESRFHEFADNIDAVFWIVASDLSQVQYVSPAYERVWGRDVASLYENPRSWFDAVYPEDRPGLSEAIERSKNAASPTPTISEYRILRTDGQVRWVRSRQFAIRDENQRAVRFVGIAEDITDRKQLDVFRETQNEFMRQLLAGMDLSKLLDSLVLMLEGQTVGMLGSVMLVEPATNSLRVTASPHLPDEYVRLIDRLPIGPRCGVSGTATFRKERVIVADAMQDSLTAPWRDLLSQFNLKAIWSEPIFAADGFVLGTFALYLDAPREPSSHELDLIATASHLASLAIDWKQNEQQRDQLIAKLEAKNDELERFAYTVSHDLKNPLVTIRGFVNLLQQDAAAGDTLRMAHDSDRINTAADKMEAMLTELLELSRIGQVVHQPVQVSLDDIVRDTLELLAGTLAERNVEIRMAADLPTLWCDRQRMVQVFQNLLVNAIKFAGDQPQAVIEIGVRNQDGEQVYYVRDNGIGIDPRYHEKVFGLFNRLNPNTEGTGFGLTLVRRVIESHGGRVWVESAGTGKGCTFCFTIGRPKLAGVYDRQTTERRTVDNPIG